MTLNPEELRILGLCAPQLLKLLGAREERILKRIHGDFRNGKLDQITALAEFCSVRDQINEINSALRGFNQQEEKKHATANSDHGNAD